MIGQRDKSLSSLSKAPNTEMVRLFEWDMSMSPCSETAGEYDIHTFLLYLIITCSSKFDVFASHLVPVLHCADSENVDILPGTTHKGRHLVGKVGRIIDNRWVLKGCLQIISLKLIEIDFLLYIIVKWWQIVGHGSFLKNTLDKSLFNSLFNYTKHVSAYQRVASSKFYQILLISPRVKDLACA